MLYALTHKNDIYGLFDSIETCKIFVKGLEDKKLVKSENFVIKEYHKNSILFVKDHKFVNQDKKIINDKPKKLKTISPEKRKEKDELERKIFLLQEQKDILLQKKQLYEEDLKLYNLFKNKIKENNKFDIPKLFKNKYKLYKKLEDENKLEFKYYNKEYKPETLNTSYKGLFMQNEN